MELSIVIPAYNEAKTIANVVRNLSAKLQEIEDSFEIVVVDNGSTDETPHILESLKNEFPFLLSTRVFPNQGYGNGILAGLAIARGEVIGWMHADNQVRPGDVAAVYKKLIDENLDFCKATRIIRKEHPIRILQSKIYNSLFGLMFQAPCGDINGSPKIFRQWLYEKAGLRSRDWFIDPEIVIKAVRHGAQIGEVPIAWKAREGGSSKVGIGTGFEFLKNMLHCRFLNKK